MKKTIQDKMHQYISFRAHLIYIAHRQLLSIKEHSKKNAAFWNSLSPCEQTESYIYSLAELKRRTITNGTKYPPKKYDSPLLNFTVKQHDLNEFSDEAHKYVRQLDIQYILTQTTITKETVKRWSNVDMFVARFILENRAGVNGISSLLNFFNPTDPLTTFFQRKNIDPTQPDWAVLSIINEIPSIHSSVDPAWYSSIGRLFYNAFTLENFAILAVDSDDTSSNRYALIVDRNNREWHTWMPEQQKKLKIKGAIDAKNNATLNLERPLQKMKIS
jgi:hypothetical protein